MGQDKNLSNSDKVYDGILFHSDIICHPVGKMSTSGSQVFLFSAQVLGKGPLFLTQLS